MKIMNQFKKGYYYHAMLFGLIIVTIATETFGFTTVPNNLSVPSRTVNNNNNNRGDNNNNINNNNNGIQFTTTRSSSPLFSAQNNKNNNNLPNQADFEYQELKIQLGAMQEQNVVTAQLMPAKRIELEGYVKRIVNRRASPIPMYDVGKYLSAGTKWRLAFSTQSLVSDLPKDARISLHFLNDSMLNYILEFTKTFGLNKLTARSSYTVDSSPVNPGLVTYTYEKITTDIFGLSNIGVGMFGMLSGRSSYIPTVYFDGFMWIEKGTDQTTGMEYYNVYTLVEDDGM